MVNSTFYQNLWSRFCKHLLALCWCLGLLLGILAASASDDLVSMMRRSLSCPVSIPGLLAATVLPFLLSAYAVSLSEPWLLLPICMVKAFGFGFCAFGVSLAFGSAGWLVRLLFLFSDVCVIPVLFFYWLRHIRGDAARSYRDLVCCLIAAVAIGAMDLYFVSPFLVKLIEI